jgi:Fe-S cluster assembly protein SufD
MKDILEMNRILASQFEQNEKQLALHMPGFISDLRRDAIDNFIRLGLPGKDNEAYKYVAITHAFEPDYTMQLTPSKIDFNVEDIFTCDVPNLKTRLEIILNGFYFSREEPLAELDNGILIGSLAAAMKKYPELTMHHFSKYADYRSSGLVALNTAFAQDGLFVYLPPGTKLQHPIQVVNLPMTGLDTLLHYRNLIILEENSHGEIIVCDHTLSPFRFLTNSVTEIFAGKNTQFYYSRVQNEHLNSNLITNLYIQQEKDSRVTTNSITLHGGIIRNNTYITLNDEGCENYTYGLFFADRNQNVDN